MDYNANLLNYKASQATSISSAMQAAAQTQKYNISPRMKGLLNNVGVRPDQIRDITCYDEAKQLIDAGSAFREHFSQSQGGRDMATGAPSPYTFPIRLPHRSSHFNSQPAAINHMQNCSLSEVSHLQSVFCPVLVQPQVSRYTSKFYIYKL